MYGIYFIVVAFKRRKGQAKLEDGKARMGIVISNTSKTVVLMQLFSFHSNTVSTFFVLNKPDLWKTTLHKKGVATYRVVGGVPSARDELGFPSVMHPKKTPRRKSGGQPEVIWKGIYSYVSSGGLDRGASPSPLIRATARC